MKQFFAVLWAAFFMAAPAFSADYTSYQNTDALQSTDEFLIDRGGTNYNWNPTYWFIDLDGNAAGATTITLPNVGLHLLDTDATHDLIWKPGSNLTADRTFTVTTGDANRTLTLGADSSISGTAYVAAGTDVTLADGGTGASLTDPNADRILFWDDSAGATTWLDLGAGLSISGTTLSGTGYLAGGTDVALADGGTGASLTDPNADRIMFWDDSAGSTEYLQAGSGLAISGTTISATNQILNVPLHAAAGSQVTNSTSNTSFLSNSSRHVTKVDLTNYSQVRFLVKQESVSDATATMALRYYTSFSNTPSNYIQIGTSEVSVPLQTTGVYLDSGWIDLASGAKTDVFLAAVVLNITSAATTVGSVTAQFR